MNLNQMSDNEFFDLCIANPSVWIERTAQGTFVISPPDGGEAAFQTSEVVGQLCTWAKPNGRGKVFGPTAEFILPTQAALCPKAAWVSNQRLAAVPKALLRKFPPLTPEFVVELAAPKTKMAEWMAGGVELAWLLDPDHQTVFIYRAGQTTPDERTAITHLAGEGPIAGFELDLTEIWAGL